MTSPTPPPEPLIAFRQVSMQFGAQRVLHGIDLDIYRGQTVAVIGESGCGKTVLLKLAIGLLRPTVGRVTFDGKVMTELPERELVRQRLRFGFLFQGAALFDSLSVYDNVAFGLRAQRRPEGEIQEIVRQRLREVGLPADVVRKKPAELSGGQKKRVGLARALALDPEVMLYDEPTTGLDPIMTDVINELILQTRQRRPVTSVIVTHEMRTVYKVSNRVVMIYPLARLAPGGSQILFDGTPEELPRSTDARVRQFVEGEARDRLQEQTAGGTRKPPVSIANAPRPGRATRRVCGTGTGRGNTGPFASRRVRAMNERTMRVTLGLFVALALVLVTALVVLFNSLPRFFRSTIPYTVVFPEAPGVSQGTPVRRAGVRIGEVTSVALDDTDGGRVRVGIAVDREHPVRQNEQPTLVSSILGGDATIDFLAKVPEPGEVPDRSPVPPGAELAGVSQVTVNALINRASAVVPTTEKTMEDIRNSLRRLERMSPLMEDTMREYRDLARDARNTVPDVRKTNDEVRELAKSLRESLPDFRRDGDDIAATARTYTKLGERLDVLLQANQDKIVKAIDSANEVLYARGGDPQRGEPAQPRHDPQKRLQREQLARRHRQEHRRHYP